MTEQGKAPAARGLGPDPSIFKTRCQGCGLTLWAASKEVARWGKWTETPMGWFCPAHRKLSAAEPPLKAAEIPAIPDSKG